MRLRSFNYTRAVDFGMKRTWAGDLIRLRSKPYTHSELEFGEDFQNVSFSTTLQDNVRCARFKQIDYTGHPERWDSVEVKVTPEQEKRIFHTALMMAGNLKYDFWGLLSFGTPLKIIKPNRDKMWCSELVAHMIQLVYKSLPTIPHLTHPQRLHEVCQGYFCPEEIE